MSWYYFIVYTVCALLYCLIFSCLSGSRSWGQGYPLLTFHFYFILCLQHTMNEIKAVTALTGPFDFSNWCSNLTRALNNLNVTSSEKEKLAKRWVHEMCRSFKCFLSFTIFLAPVLSFYIAHKHFHLLWLTLVDIHLVSCSFMPFSSSGCHAIKQRSSQWNDSLWRTVQLTSTPLCWSNTPGSVCCSLSFHFCAPHALWGMRPNNPRGRRTSIWVWYLGSWHVTNTVVSE